MFVTFQTDSPATKSEVLHMQQTAKACKVRLTNPQGCFTSNEWKVEGKPIRVWRFLRKIEKED